MGSKPSQYSYYRWNFLKRTIFPVFVIPLLITLFGYIGLRSSNIKLPWTLKNLLYPTTVVLYNVLRIQYDQWYQRREARRFGARLVPRVQGKWIGNLDLVLKKSPQIPYLGQRLEDMFDELGSRTINMRILWVDNIISMDERVVKYVLATGFENFEKGKRSYEIRESFLGGGIFNRDGDVWRAHRALARPFFAKERIKDFDTFELSTSQLISVIDNHQSQSLERSSESEKATQELQAFDVQDLFARLIVDVAATFLFTTPLQTLSLPLPSALNAKLTAKGITTPPGSFGIFTTAFEQCQDLVIARQRNEFLWPLFEWWGDKMEEPMKVIEEWLDPIVRDTLERNKKRKADMGLGNKHGNEEEGKTLKEDECSFLEFLAESTEDVEKIRTELLNILLAARDSTNSLLTFIIYMFTQHPDVVARLRAEVLNVCPPGQTPTYEDLKEMRYLRAVIHETLRVFPPVHTILRASGSKSCVITLNGKTSHSKASSTSITVNPNSSVRSSSLQTSSPPSQTQFQPPTSNILQQDDAPSEIPLYIPPHTSISLVPLLVHRRKDTWGPDADVFDPDRWIDLRMERVRKNPMMFVPFNAGPRICLGQQFTLNQASYYIVRLLQTYSSFELALDCQPRNCAPPPYWKEGRGRAKEEKVFLAGAFTLFVRGGLWVRFKKADNDESLD